MGEPIFNCEEIKVPVVNTEKNDKPNQIRLVQSQKYCLVSKGCKHAIMLI